MSGEEEIVDVWGENLEEEFDKIRQIIVSYPYVAMVSFRQSKQMK